MMGVLEAGEASSGQARLPREGQIEGTNSSPCSHHSTPCRVLPRLVLSWDVRTARGMHTGTVRCSDHSLDERNQDVHHAPTLTLIQIRYLPPSQLRPQASRKQKPPLHNPPFVRRTRRARLPRARTRSLKPISSDMPYKAIIELQHSARPPDQKLEIPRDRASPAKRSSGGPQNPDTIYYATPIRTGGTYIPGISIALLYPRSKERTKAFSRVRTRHKGSGNKTNDRRLTVPRGIGGTP
ncbi:hypothetical protein BC628DRAFT_152340 [Trametes gibbosa]|nr:hypothetical protein BC628DRAFT_152340 [Trametes gibbosa]